MELSTTINFFIYPDDGSFSAYKDDLRRYASLGFKKLDAIFCSAAAQDSPLRKENWMDWAHAMREEADRLGISFAQTHVPFYNFCHPETGINEDTEDIVRKTIVCTGILGAYWTVAHPATAFGECFMVSESKKRNIEYFSGHLALAKENNVGICIENMADFPGQGYKRSYCAAVEELCDLVDTLNGSFDNVGICWDFGHANLVYRDQVPCLTLIGDRLKVTHVHDNRGENDDHLTPYLGNVNWEAIMPALRKIGYQGDFSFEIRRMTAPVPDELKDSMWLHAKKIGEYLMSLM